MKGLLIVFGVILLAGFTLVGSYVSAYNKGNRMENQIIATYENNKQILGQYGQKIQEAAQIPSMQTEDLVKIFTNTLGARYGKDGSQAAFQWIKEQNPSLDQSTYKKLQQIIESGRNDFTNAQQELVDRKRGYRTELGSLWTGTFMKFAGYPHLAIGYPYGTKDDFPAISTARADDTFKKGKEDGPIKLR